jgi:nucleoside 2-deoxyribosyltransferase
MQYHAILNYSDKNHFWYNHSKETIIDKVLVPFINGQIVPITYGENLKKLLNMKNTTFLSVYSTENKLIKMTDNSIVKQMKAEDFKQYDCTEEILNEVKGEISAYPSRSIIEKKFTDVKNQVFVVMKFGDQLLDSAYEGVIEPVIREFGLEPIRVDKLLDSGKINDQIIENIATSKYILADLTGERPNCYYEAGYAHALGKDVILTIMKNEKIHFDLSGNRFIQWATEADLRSNLRERFKFLTEKNED